MAGDVSTATTARLDIRVAAPRALRALRGYDLLLCGLLGLVAAARMWLVPGYFRADSWLALTAGRDVWSSGIPHHETLTSITAGGRWIDQQWLSHLMTYSLYRAGGLALIAATAVLLTAGSFAAVMVGARALHARARTVLLLTPVTLFPFFAQSWQPRTQTFAYPLFVAVFLILLLDARRPSRRVLIALPLLAVWANLHGSVILGACLVVARGCLMTREPRGRLTPAALIAFPALLLLATPYGLGTARYYRSTLLDGSFRRLAGEWQPITHDPLLLVPFACLVALTAWTLVRGRRDTSTWERMALVLLLVAAANALRNMVWLSLGALPVLAAALDRVVPADPAASSSGERLNRLVAVLSGVALVLALATTFSRPAGDFERAYPSSYLAAVRHAAALDPTARIVADVGDADWLLWRDPGLRGRLAFDARLELLSAARVGDIASLLRGAHGSRLRGRDYRIFALDRRAAWHTVAELTAEPGGRILYTDRQRIVVLLRHTPA